MRVLGYAKDRQHQFKLQPSSCTYYRAYVGPSLSLCYLSTLLEPLT